MAINVDKSEYGETTTAQVLQLNGLGVRKTKSENSKPSPLDRIFEFLGVDSYGKISNGAKETSANIGRLCIIFYTITLCNHQSFLLSVNLCTEHLHIPLISFGVNKEKRK
jgi:hypothetical protein